MSDAGAANRMIPQTDPGAFYRRHREEVDQAVARVLASGWYILGSECAAFEKEFAAALGLQSTVGVANGTDALVLALRAIGVGPGDLVATVSHTAVATVAAIELAGAAPVFVDIDPESLTMDPAELARTIDALPGIKAVIAVHLYGQPADIPAILAVVKPRGVKLIEDCAQAHGALIGSQPVGSLGDIAAFSFYPTKNLGAFGDGGAVACAEPAILERLRMLREYGWKERLSEFAGMNSRLDEMQAAILRVRLTHLAAGNARRQAIAAAYTKGLSGLDLKLPQQRPGSTHVYHQYVVRHRHRDALIADLKRAGVGCNIHYPVPAHLQRAYLGRHSHGPSGLAATEAAAQTVLSLPMYPEHDDDAAARVVEVVRGLMAGR